MRLFLASFLLITMTTGWCQPGSEASNFLSKLNNSGGPPQGITSSRSMALFYGDFQEKELEDIQAGLQPIGEDAVCYVDAERALAGRDRRKCI